MLKAEIKYPLFVSDVALYHFKDNDVDDISVDGGGGDKITTMSNKFFFLIFNLGWRSNICRKGSKSFVLIANICLELVLSNPEGQKAKSTPGQYKHWIQRVEIKYWYIIITLRLLL